MPRPLRIGHRGAAGHAPENTLLSVETALRLGVDVVEIDVHRSLDGQLVVMHDSRVDRTTGGSGYIRDLTFDRLRALRIPPEQSVPSLEEVLRAVTGRAALMIELKVRGIASQVLDAVRAAGPGIPVCYASFLHSELLLLREWDRSAQTIALIDAAPVEPAAFAVAARASIAGIAFDSLERQAVSQLHHAGIGVFTYTVDDPRDISAALALGVDGLISNFPDRLPAA